MAKTTEKRSCDVVAPPKSQPREHTCDCECTLPWWESIYDNSYMFVQARKMELGMCKFSHYYTFPPSKFEKSVEALLKSSIKVSRIRNACKTFMRWFNSEDLENSVYVEEVPGDAVEVFVLLRNFWLNKDDKHVRRNVGEISVVYSCVHKILELTHPIVAEAGISQQDSTVQEQNTTFTDQRETTTDDGYITTQILPNLQRVSMPEENWHVRDIMAKPIPIWSGDWTTSQALNFELKYWDLPGAALFGPHYNLVSTFTFFRGHPEIRFQVNGTKFHCGRLIAAFVPVYDQDQYDDKLYTVSNLVSLPHVILDASIANSGVISLPFVHMNTYFNTAAQTRGWQSLGRLKLMVFNKLRAATSSSQSIGVTAWISFKNCELHQPCFAHKPNLPGIKPPISAPIVAESGVEGLVKSAIPLITDIVAPEIGLGNVAGAIGSVAGGASNQDKPTDPIEISRWVPNVVTGLAQGDGLDKSSRMCLQAGSYTIPEADLISTTQDDMNLLELCKIPVRLDLFDWSSGQGTGTRLAHIPVCPNVITGYKTDSSVKPPVELIAPTMLAYISRYFKYWRGSLRYKLQIVASQMHTGRLMVSFGAGINLPNSSSFAMASYLNTYTIDLQEKHEVEFVVPFLAERPWLRCDRFRKYDETAKSEVGQFNWENVGYLDIYILNRLSHPEAVSSSVSVNVLISAGDDFELAFPSELSAYQGTGEVIDIRPGRAVAESLVNEETVTSRQDEGVITLGKGTGYVNTMGRSTMGENAMDLKTLVRRYTKVYANNRVNVGDGANMISFVNSPVVSSVNKCFNSTQGVQCRTALSHFSELFTFWRGSLRYKLVYQISIDQESSTPIVGNISLRVIHVPGVYNYGNFTPKNLSADERAMFHSFDSQGIVVGGTNNQGSIEFEIPFYTPYTQLRCLQGALANTRSATGTVFIVMEAPQYRKGVYATLELYQAAGDDFTLNYLRAAPLIQFISAYDTTRALEDNAPFIHESTPPICSGMSALTLNEEEEIKAEALSDYIPGVPQVKQTLTSVSNMSIKVDSVCDTANHLLQQASKKLGLTASDEDEEEPITTIFEDASSACAPMIPILECAISYVKMLPQEFAQYLNPNVTLGDLVVEVSNIVSGLSSFVNSTNFLCKVCAVVTIVSTLLKECTIVLRNSLYHFVTQVFGVLNKHDNNQGNELSQAEALSFDLVAPLTATFAVALGAIGFKKIPTDKETVDLCKGISEKLRLFNFSSSAMQNVKNLWNDIKDLIQWCIDYVMNLLAPQFLAQLKLERAFGDIEEWAQFIDSLENIAYADKIHYDYEFRNKVYRAIDQGKKYNNLLLEGKCGRAASVIREYVRKVTEIGLHCERSKNELPFRKDPFCIFMYGATNIGKSGCITTVGFDIMDRLGYPQHNRWCAINCTEKFFSENYRQQAAVYFDDFSTFTSEEQYQKFFNLKANTAFPLDMAFRKGEYFNSDFIFGTTNTPYPQPNFVTNLSALLRRRDMLIEADWADDPAIQEALANNRPMAPFRRLDCTHLKYRLRNPEDEQAAPGNWMSYDELIVECHRQAAEHLRRQQEKLTHDLTRCGYIVPQAEAAEIRRICLEAVINSPSLKLFDPEMWKFVEWDAETQTFDCFAQGDDAWAVEEFDALKKFMETAKIDLNKILKDNSYVVKQKIPLMSKVSNSLSDLKAYLKKQVDSICEKFPFIKHIGKWSIMLAAAIATCGAMWYGVKKVAHGCICKTLLHYGYRCGFCGKWPAFESVKPNMQNFMLEQWQSLYGNLAYKDYHVTSLQEEAALLSLQKKLKCEITEPFLGTKVHAESIYSDVTRGQKVVKVVANNGTYSQDVKGQTRIKVSANTGVYSQDVKGQPRVKTTAEGQQVDDLITRRIFPYMYRVRTFGGPGLSSMSVNAYAIGDRRILVNNHLFYGLKNGDMFEIYHNGAWMTVEYLLNKCIVLPNKDACIYEMPIQFHSHKSNVHHFISEKELEFFQAGSGALCKLDGAMNCVQVDGLQIKAQLELKYELNAAGKTIPLYVQKAWAYNKCSSYGDCGSPLVTYSDKISGKILGIHTASSPSTSYSQLITREMLEGVVKRFNGTPIPEAEARFTNMIPEGHLGRIGVAPKGKEFYQSPKTEIIPTAIQGFISEPTTAPAVLSINDPRLTRRVNPLKLGIEKYSFTSIPFPEEHRAIVNDYMREECRLMIRSRNPRPLTLHEAVVGIPTLEGYERLPQNTSPGYPWILTRPKGAYGKSYLFDEETFEPLFDLKKAFDYRHEQAKKLERVESVWVDCLKDERRSLEKIAKGSTRMFTIPPVDFSLLMRMYTMDWCVAMKNSRDFMDCKVGMDPQSMEWTTLYNYLSEFSTLCVAGDFTRFDGSMPADLIYDVKGDIDFFYEEFGECSEEDKNVRSILFDELVNTVHLARNEYYMTHIGNKSGNPITVNLNSKINKRYMALAWLGLAMKYGFLEHYNMDSFRRNVRCAIYGDDNILAIKEEVIEWYNQETISEYLAQFNIIYTNEEKTGITKYKHLDECTFLKQSFKNHSQLASVKVPHMKMQTILELLNWTRVAPNQDELLFQNCNDALRFSYFYGEKFYNQLRLKIINALEKANRRFFPKTYMDYHLWFLQTIGMLKVGPGAEGFLTELAGNDTPAFKKLVMATTLGPLSWAFSLINGPVKDDGRIREDRYAVCIPSGEGKSWLARNYPDLFVDHDEITLPRLEEKYNELKHTERWLAAGNEMLNPQQYDTPPSDKRILLTHHPNSTNRKILSQYVLPYPNFNRNNLFNRALLDRPIVRSRAERNEELIKLAKSIVH